MATQTEMEFRAKRGGKSQNEKLRDVFLSRPNEWIGLPELVALTGSYVVHSRAADLRSEGLNIENDTSHRPGSTCRSWYRYVPHFPDPPALAPADNGQPRRLHSSPLDCPPG